MRLVIDTVVVLRALFDPFSWSGRVVFDALNDHELVVSGEIVVEYVDVINRPSLARRFRTVATRDISRLYELLENATEVQLQEIPFVCRDRGDDHLLATALIAQADFLVTEDKDLLVLQSYFSPRIVTAKTFLDELNPGGD